MILPANGGSPFVKTSTIKHARDHTSEAVENVCVVRHSSAIQRTDVGRKDKSS